MEIVEFYEERAFCPFFAVDPQLGLIAVSALTTARELGMRIAARIVAGQAVPLGDKTILQRQRDIEIPLVGEDKPFSYKASYTRTHPHKLETRVGYETVVLHRDVTTRATSGHWGYLLRFEGETEPQFLRRFLYQWGRVTELPARPEWAKKLWAVGSKSGLITPLQTMGCEGWRIDPRWDLPAKIGWREILKNIVLLEK